MHRVSIGKHQDRRRHIAAWALSLSILVLLLKFVAYKVTGSTAILTDAAESIINVVAGGFALYAVVLSSRPADANHPYGHGKADYFSAGFEGAFIIIAAVMMLFRAGRAIYSPYEIVHLDIGMMLTAVGGSVNGLLGWFLVRSGRQERSIVLEADGKHLLTDAYTSWGVVVGLLVVHLTGIKIIDPLMAMLLALQILITGYRLVAQSFGGLMDAASPLLLRQLTDSLRSIREPAMIDIHYLRARRVGDQYHIDFHLILPRFWNIEEEHSKVHEITDRLLVTLGEEGEVLIHPEPCTPDLCRHCQMQGCPVRSTAFEKLSEWKTEDLTVGPFASRSLDKPQTNLESKP